MEFKCVVALRFSKILETLRRLQSAAIILTSGVRISELPTKTTVVDCRSLNSST